MGRVLGILAALSDHYNRLTEMYTLSVYSIRWRASKPCTMSGSIDLHFKKPAPDNISTDSNRRNKMPTRVLALCGFTQNAYIFKKQLGAIRKTCKDVEFGRSYHHATKHSGCCATHTTLSGG